MKQVEITYRVMVEIGQKGHWRNLERADYNIRRILYAEGYASGRKIAANLITELYSHNGSGGRKCRNFIVSTVKQIVQIGFKNS